MKTETMTPGTRLRQARERVGFSSAAAAAKAMGVPIATYTGHEADHRGFPAKKAAIYARTFHVSVNWLLFGTDESAAPGHIKVPVVGIIDNGKSTIRDVREGGHMVAEAPSYPEGIRCAWVLSPDCMHYLAGWTLFGEEKTDRLSEIAEDKLCMVGLSNGHTVLAKPRRAATSGLFHLYFFGQDPQTDVKVNWISRIVASTSV